MDAQQEFAKLMHEWRLKLGITQEQLAEIVGISTAYCRKIEKGKNCPTWYIWLKICKVLDLDVLEIENIVFNDLEQ